MSETGKANEPMPPAGEPRVRPYACYALFVLLLGNILNNLDRYILSILALDIKRDLQLTDAELGFLLGTAFAVFYAIMGIAMGRIADGMSRSKLMAAGLTLWSAMTALGGAATSFAMLSAARVGVGIGEATGHPCSHSLLSSYFPARNRALILAIYTLGAFIGATGAMVIGGLFLENWTSMCREVPIAGVCSLPGWKATLITVGLPGLLVALLVVTLREPPRPGFVATPVGRLVARELGASLPPLSAFNLLREGGSEALHSNLLLIGALVLAAALLSWLTGNPPQWIAAALGTYAVVTWGRIQKLRDRPFFDLTLGFPTFLLALIGSSMIAAAGGAASAWAAPYAMRTLGMSPAEAGISLGLTYAGAAIVGVVLGGWITDRWKRSDLRAPIWFGMISLLGGFPGLLIMVVAEDGRTFLAGYALFGLMASGWSGGFTALVQDLVLPRMRGAAASVFALINTLLIAGIGPYWVGKVSMMTGSLGAGLLSVELLVPFALVVLYYTARRMQHETAEARLTRARAAGEPL